MHNWIKFPETEMIDAILTEEIWIQSYSTGLTMGSGYKVDEKKYFYAHYNNDTKKISNIEFFTPSG